MSARDRILGKVRATLLERGQEPHPGDFAAWRPEELALPPPGPAAVDRFGEMFEAAGGEVVRVGDESAAADWIRAFAADFASASVGRGVPRTLHPPLERVEPERADLGVSMARAAITETGSLAMDARDGRRAQLLVPVHVVVVRADQVYPTLREALVAFGSDLPSAIGLHSGPSKSADIGQIMVKGVHGPGRVVALVVGA